ncbi:uncharacterized protein LOC131239114 [Magnolia sinica]|uniref:uncharacterized protein LOC131239114 n=1 Tax=Magnolia sinica TaxID=86752 RepID=UPI00265879C0|nr:uncharacterized protein LOC131239114 [Magnolia sinica]
MPLSSHPLQQASASPHSPPISALQAADVNPNISLPVYHEENSDHLFCLGSTANTIWAHFHRIFDVPLISSHTIHKCIMFWASRASLSPCLKLFLGMTPTLICWKLCLSRNAARFDSIRMSDHRIIARVSSWLQELGSPLPANVSSSLSVASDSASLLLGPGPAVSLARPQLVIWRRPCSGWVNLNVDGSSRGNQGESGGGGVCRDSHGRFLFAFHRYYGNATNTITEAQVMVDGIILCSKLGYSNVEVESDSKIVMDIVAAPSGHCLWNIWYRMGAIHQFNRPLNISFNHILREGNVVADALARAASEGCSNSFFRLSWDLPRHIRGSLVLDKAGLENLRA